VRGRASSARGFTLIELMVVVILVAILSTLAIPALSKSRNDQIAFDYARKVQLVFNRARVRANAGAAQVVVGDFSARGKITLYELVGTSCTTAGALAEIPAWPAGTVSTAKLELLDGVDFDTTSNIVAAEDIKAQLSTGQKAFAYCITPSGRILAGTGAGVADAILDMQTMASQPTFTFKGTLDIRVSRLADLTVRSVLVTAGSSARILTRK
jgi:type IV fimbrial biogenesis protein FimU